MKKILFLFAALSMLSLSFATTTVEVPKKLRADQIFLPAGKAGQQISLAQLATISLKDLQLMTGRKMNFVERVSIKAAQLKLRNSIDKDGTINSKKLEKYMKKARGGETGFHFGGFALGFLLGLIGVLVAYLINDDFKKNRVKWAWIGLGIAVVISLVLILSGGGVN